jgi:two-component system phosphate regulon sensor histidine kinase PhoR
MSHLTFKYNKDLIFFLSLTLVILVQAVWWIVFMARLVDEKVDLAVRFGADPALVETLHAQEIRRQMMVGMEGIFFLILILAGAWLIYRSLVKAEELKTHQQNFLMAVTHELKTPLASLKVYLDTLESPKIPSDKRAGITPKMKQEVDRLDKLVENILDAGRFERRGYHLNREPFNLTDLVDGLIESLKGLPTGRPLEINRALALGVMYTGDPAAFGRAVNAVLGNCLLYNESDRIVLQVTMKKESRNVVLAITDNGIGLDGKDCSRIFNRFYRVGDELRRSRPGTGLGLYLAREIIRRHGGELSARSEGLGRGTTFTIQLSLEDQHEDDSIG